MHNKIDLLNYIFCFLKIQMNWVSIIKVVSLNTRKPNVSSKKTRCIQYNPLLEKFLKIQFALIVD